MGDLRVIARLSIHDGKLDQFKQVAQSCLNCVKEKDKGTRQYDWFMNPDQTECVVLEHYVDSNAVFEHMGNLGETLDELLSITDMALEVYGSPSQQLIDATKDMDIKIYGFHQGL